MQRVSKDWCPESYLKFSDERLRPAIDLLARVRPILPDPLQIYDLGCGPGTTSTLLLRESYAGAQLTGIDNSRSMLETARQSLDSVEFEEADLESWSPREKADLLFSNATLQWVRDHVGVMQRLLLLLPKGGVLAVQMPNNLSEPSHRLMAEVAQEGPWAENLKMVALEREQLLSISGYYNALYAFSEHLSIWQTCYVHALENITALIDFVSSTGLRPYLLPLDEQEKAQFLESYRLKLTKAYPPQDDGRILFRFPRLFIVAQK